MCLSPLIYKYYKNRNGEFNYITQYIMPKNNCYLVTKVMIAKELPQTTPVTSYPYSNTNKKNLKNYLLLSL